MTGRARSLTVALALLLATAARMDAGQAPFPRTTNGHPDFGGIWQARAAGAATKLPGRLPYQPWALAKQRANFLKRRTEDPLNKCYIPGVPRIMYLDRPFQIFQTPDIMAMTFEWSNMYRVIATNGSPHPEGIEFSLGDSRGRWEGDTLVVDVRNYNDRTWFDRAGNFHSEAMTLVERYTPVDADTIAYEATITDAKVFTKPWTIAMPLKRRTDIDRLSERICLAEQEEANGSFEREPATWYPGNGTPSMTFTPEQMLAAARPKVAAPTPAPNAKPFTRLPDGTPELQGYYTATDSAGGNYGLEAREGGLGKGRKASKGFIVDPPDGRLPVQPWARALQQDRLRPERAYDDPAAHCLPIGSPRGVYLNELQILQPPGYVVFLFERMGYRIVALDGRAHPPDNVRRWQGDSVGHWEHDTLVVDTTNFTGKTWLNEPAGEHGGEVLSYAEHLIERFTPIDATSVQYEATVIDPVAYTRPWTAVFPMKKIRGELLEVACKEDDQDLAQLKVIRDQARAAAKKAGRRP